MRELSWGETWPSWEEFAERGTSSRVVPVVMPLLVDDTSPTGIYRRLAQPTGSFILESAEQGRWSRWSFVGVSSSAVLTASGPEGRWLGEVPAGLSTSGRVTDLIEEALTELASSPDDDLPPLTGGLVGALGWDVLYDWEPTLARNAVEESELPFVALCLADELVAIDHQRSTAWLVCNAINRNNTSEGMRAAYDRAVSRLVAMREGLSSPAPAHASGLRTSEDLAESMRVAREDFEAAVETGKEHIRAGDVFQVVLSQRADIDCPAPPLEVYRVLRSINPSPYMYYLALPGGPDGVFHVVGSSPETLINARAGRATVFPIAGSRPRGQDAEEDRRLAEELLKDPKEVSEHVMLVDLARNDLAKVCEPGTVEVREFMDIHRFSHIMHITSEVSGQLRENASAVDCLRAAFPAGTLSGAPKPSAISIIDDLEPARRGIYGGVVGYFDFAGNADLAIAIRTAVLSGGRASVQAGAGIVADSVPATEYEETKAKAFAALTAIRLAARLSTGPDARA
ncbi:MAG: chorismate-binding protein [Flaviflexus sp.]|nr:chorismate-binding protein [Flaviflexus sp.]